MARTFGVHSEIGKLRTVIVCRPGLAHQRLTPGNCHDLLFDDVVWVQEAQKDHYDFVLKMQQRGAEVLDLHELLAETLTDLEARSWVLDRRITANSVGLIVARAVRPWLDAMPAKRLAEHLIGGIAIEDLPKSESSALLLEVLGGTSFSDTTDPEHPLSARSVLLDLWRRHLQPDVLASAETRKPVAAGDLQISPGL
jgi:arginine deiminase